MKDLQKDISRWGAETFGDPAPRGLAIRGNKEMAELLSGFENGRPNNELAEECADVCFFLLQICEGLGYDLQEEVEKKFEINKRRSWAKGSDGSFQHVKENAA